MGVLEGAAEGSEPVVLAVFVGGATLAEISALRWLSAQPGPGRVRYVVATTKLISGGALIESVVGEPLLRRGAASAIVGARARGISP